MLSQVRFPIVYTGSPKDPPLKYGIDLRGCTFRQAKVMIMRSNPRIITNIIKISMKAIPICCVIIRSLAEIGEPFSFSISKNSIEAHNEKMSAENTSTGGAIFKFTLPIKS